MEQNNKIVLFQENTLLMVQYSNCSPFEYVYSIDLQSQRLFKRMDRDTKSPNITQSDSRGVGILKKKAKYYEILLPLPVLLLEGGFAKSSIRRLMPSAKFSNYLDLRSQYRAKIVPAINMLNNNNN